MKCYFIDAVVRGLQDEIGNSIATVQYLLSNIPKPSDSATWHHWHLAVMSQRCPVPRKV